MYIVHLVSLIIKEEIYLYHRAISLKSMIHRKYTHQTVKRKAFADMIEALIGAFLISSNYIIRSKFMHWLGLNDEMRRIFYEEGFEEIENRLNYVFKNKGYLISAFTHPSKLTLYPREWLQTSY